MVLEIVSIIALIAGPVLAVEVQKRGDQRRERRNRRLGVFRSLMTTRAQRLGWEHVQSLNMIDVEFSGPPDAKPVIDAWGLYFNHLCIPKPRPPGWEMRSDELFIDLLYVMSLHLGYDFDKVHLKNQAYSPEAHGNLEVENAEIRKSLISVLAGKTAITIRPGEAAQSPPPVEAIDATTPVATFGLLAPKPEGKL